MAQLLMESHDCQVGIAFQQLRHGLLERIQPTGPSRALLLRHTRAAIFMICQYLGHRLAVDSQHPSDAPPRSAPVGQPDDLVTRFFVHRLSSSLSRSRLRAATAPASCASFRKRGRSEEHTSELQSRLHLVCRLLLEKKKKYNKNINTSTLI